MPPKGSRHFRGGYAKGNTRDATREAFALREQRSNDSTATLDLIPDKPSNASGRFTLILCAVVVTMLGIKLHGECLAIPTTSRTQEEVIALKQKIAAARNSQEFAETQLSSNTCNEECRRGAVTLRDESMVLANTIPTDYAAILGVTESITLSKETIRRAYEDVKERIDRGEESVRHIDLAELEEARWVLTDNDARMFVALNGQRPPEFMRNLGMQRATTYGGEGLEHATNTHLKNKILRWMDQVNSVHLDVAVLLLMGLASVLPVLCNFRTILTQMRYAFPELDEDTYDAHQERMKELREASLKRPRGHRRC